MSVSTLHWRMNAPATGIQSLRERGARPGVAVTEAIAEELSVTVMFWHGRVLEIERTRLMPLCRRVGQGA